MVEVAGEELEVELANQRLVNLPKAGEVEGVELASRQPEVGKKAGGLKK